MDLPEGVACLSMSTVGVLARSSEPFDAFEPFASRF
jgi:hypothetical protein